LIENNKFNYLINILTLSSNKWGLISEIFNLNLR
jgi:hypothetical protein